VFVLGHVGIGYAVTRKWMAGKPFVPFALGAVFPDLIDKTLFYGNRFLRGGIDGFPPGTRSIAHTLLLTGLLFLIARNRRSAALMAFALGVLTHVVLDPPHDLVSLLVLPPRKLDLVPGWSATVWPLNQGLWPEVVFRTARDHIALSLHLVMLLEELVGCLILLRLWRQRHPASVPQG